MILAKWVHSKGLILRVMMVICSSFWQGTYDTQHAESRHVSAYGITLYFTHPWLLGYEPVSMFVDGVENPLRQFKVSISAILYLLICMCLTSFNKFSNTPQLGSGISEKAHKSSRSKRNRRL